MKALIVALAFLALAPAALAAVAAPPVKKPATQPASAPDFKDFDALMKVIPPGYWDLKTDAATRAIVEKNLIGKTVRVNAKDTQVMYGPYNHKSAIIFFLEAETDVVHIRLRCAADVAMSPAFQDCKANPSSPMSKTFSAVVRVANVTFSPVGEGPARPSLAPKATGKVAPEKPLLLMQLEVVSLNDK